MKQNKEITSTLKAPTTTEEVLDFSFCSLNEMECILDTMSTKSTLASADEKQARNAGKSNSRSLLLNNNSISEIKNLPTILISILVNPCLLGWLDLSFNNIMELPQIFKSLTSLKILYLHGNQIASMETVHNIKVLNRSLLKLTLHGNPIKDVKGYRLILINMMSHVKELDFSVVSESERKVASFLMRPKKRSPKKPKADD